MSKKDVKVLFSDYFRPSTNEDTKVFTVLQQMLAKYWNLVISPDPDFVIYSAYGCEYIKYHCKRIYFTAENHRPNFNHCDYAFSFDYPITERNYRLPWYRLHPLYEQIKLPRTVPQNFIDRKFCCFLVSNERAVERIDLFHRLSQYRRVDSGGKVLNNIGYQVGNTIEEKLDWMSQFKFSIVFENSSYPGYTTEKLFDGFLSNTIPIYWGNPKVNLDFNPAAFINCHDFNNFDEVVAFVQALDQDPMNHAQYLHQPYLPDGKETEFCKEENIIARFEEIFEGGKIFISPATKQRQRVLYPVKMGKRRFTKATTQLKRIPLRIMAKGMKIMKGFTQDK
jgi:hypothetical protein